MKKKANRDDIDEINREIRKKEEELKEITKRIEEISTDSKESNINEKKDITKDAFDLLDSYLKLIGFEGDLKLKDKSIVGFINSLAELAEKSENFQKSFNINGNEGVVDFRINKRAIKLGMRPKRTHNPSAPYSSIKIIPPAPKFDPAEKREPILELINEKNKILVIVEIPGVSEQDIKWEMNESILTIRTDIPQHMYYKELSLPGPIELENIESSFNNGVLKIVFKKKESK